MVSQVKKWRKDFPGRGNSRCQNTEAPPHYLSDEDEGHAASDRVEESSRYPRGKAFSAGAVSGGYKAGKKKRGEEGLLQCPRRQRGKARSCATLS